MAEDKKLLLIDGNSIMNRAFFGIRDLTNSKGVHTNGIFGFLNILFRTIEDENATHMAVAFDMKAPTFRHLMYESYKGNRKGMPDELREQMPLIKELLTKMNIPICEKEGIEADDILGTLAYRGSDLGYKVTILSGDRDMLQVATDQIKVSIPKTSKGQTTIENYYAKDVIDRYLVTPKEFIDVKGLMGDSSDNIPGIAGIGEKTATKWINTYHSIEGVFENTKDFSAKQQEKLENQLEIALLSRTLATIKLDCEVELELNDTLIEDLYNEEAYEVFKQLELKTFYNRFVVKSISNQNDKDAFKLIVTDNLFDLQLIIKRAQWASYYFYEDEDYTALAVCINQSVYFLDDQNAFKEELYEMVRLLLDDDEREVITFDLKKQLHIISDMNVHKKVYDLTLMAYLINPNSDVYEMDNLVYEYLNQTYQNVEELVGKGKSKVSMKTLDQPLVKAYLSLGAYYMREIAEKTLALLVQQEMMDLYTEVELPLLFVLKNMENEGIKIDSEALRHYQTMLGEKIQQEEKTIYQLAGQTFNIGSPKQLGVILFEVLKLPAEKKTKTGYSTAVDVLEKLIDQHPIIRSIMTYRTLSKLKSTYADGLFNYIAEDGRIHTTFSQKTAATGRLSSVDPNLQNIPIRMPIGREIRKVFIPKEGYVFIDADYSQIELRLLAHLSKDETFIKAFNNGEDIHRITASKVFQIPFEEVTDAQRRNAKAVNFGIVYGISGYGLSQDLGITVKLANEYINDYFEKYPSVKAFLDETVAQAKEDGFTKTMYNRIRPIPELGSSNFMQKNFGERIAMNTPIQGSAADIMKIAMIRVYNRLEKETFDAKLILTVHDELLIEVKESEAIPVKEMLIKEMESAADLSVPLTVEAHIGKNWFDAK